MRMHSNWLIIFFLHVERAQCTFCRQEDELGPAARGEEELPGGDLGRLSWRWCWWLFSVAVMVRTSDSSGASSPLCRDTSQRFLPRRFIPSVLFLPYPRLSLSVSQSISPVFVFLSFGHFSLYTIGFSISVSPLFSVVFFLLSRASVGGIYRAKGSGGVPIATL
jgi:hypothetical protein